LNSFATSLSVEYFTGGGDMNEDIQELALFKFSLIAPVVNNTYAGISQMQYFRDVAPKMSTYWCSN
jgi:hypothetical protein